MSIKQQQQQQQQNDTPSLIKRDEEHIKWKTQSQFFLSRENNSSFVMTAANKEKIYQMISSLNINNLVGLIAF